MSGDVQPRKRKDKKKKKDEEDVKETTTSHPTVKVAPPAASGDIHMHVQHDHGIGGQWCAKIVFFILLAALAGLIGLIIMENRGMSDLDTPLSESRFSEYLQGWVDENREDDHHDEPHSEHDILEALDELDDHDHDDEPFSEEEDHSAQNEDEDDDEHDGQDDEHNDNDETAEDDDDDDDEPQAPKLNEEEVEEIVSKVVHQEVAQENTNASVEEEADEELADADDDDDDEEEAVPEVDQDDNDDDDDNTSDAIAQEIEDLADADDDTPFEEEKKPNDLNALNTNKDLQSEPIVTSEELEKQMDELVENYNKLAESLNAPKVEVKVETTVDDDDDDDDDFEQFVDNDDGEDLHLKKLAETQKEPEQSERPAQESSKLPSKSGSQSYNDQYIAEELSRANQQLEDNPKAALSLFESLTQNYPDSIGALYGKAKALDRVAELYHSNSILTEAIAVYKSVVDIGDDVDDFIFEEAAERCINRMRFKGQHMNAVDVHESLIKRFNDAPYYRNQLAVTYLLAGRLADAKYVLHETLLRWIEDGFALVHYGFVLKNLDKDMEYAVQYLREGIQTGDEGTQDGRFYFHLGDALQRLGRNDEALEIYKEGAEKKLFLSPYQRSLYNIDTLKSRPFWTEEATTYQSELDVIGKNWLAIRDEGLKILSQEGYFKDEAENLKDSGDWRQFELFARGNKVVKNCEKTPFTCKLIENFPASRTCKRGQVKFSIMHPGTHVWPHCGPTNCRLRAHLGLKVPPKTFIRVADQMKTWENGKWLIFDDSFEHEVWHNGTQLRMVLIVDFWHPDITEEQRRTLSPI